MEEQLLVASARRGDHSAFAQLVELYQTPVYNLAFRMLGNVEDAEDAAQETFLRAFGQLKSYKESTKFATWLLSIDAHYCIDRLRRRKRLTWFSLEDQALGETLPSDLPEPEDETLRHESQHEVEKLLEHLSPGSRLVVTLRYWHELSIDEIAKMSGDSVSAVKVKLHRARQALAHQMNAENADCDDENDPGVAKRRGPPSVVSCQRSAARGVN